MLLGAISCAKVTISWDQKPQVRESMPKRDKADLKMKNENKKNLSEGNQLE